MDRSQGYLSLATPQSIRLLYVDYQQDASMGSYRLVHVDLGQESLPSYCCLSYAWGSPLPNIPVGPETTASSSEHEIIVQEIDRQRNRATLHAIAIGSNLHDFLVQHRERALEHTSPIWIDAVCINQSDLAERAVQVGLMSRVYSSCLRVIVWLGVEDDISRIAASIISRLAVLCQDCYKRAWGQYRRPTKESEHLTQSEFYERVGVGNVSPKAWLTLDRFLQRSWFRRVWTVQEILLPPASTFWCGKTTLDTRAIGRSLICLQDHRGSYRGPGKTTQSAFGVLNPDVMPWGRLCEMGSQFSLLGSLQDQGHTDQLVQQLRGVLPSWTRNRNCSDPRDHVYGTLGFHPLKIRIDYNSPPSGVYVEFTHAFGITDLVPRRVQQRLFKKIPDLPSWAPDFSSPTIPLPWADQGTLGYCQAGGTGLFEPLPSTDPRVLVVRGSMNDTVSIVGGRHGENADAQCLIDCLAMLDTLPSCIFDSREPLETLWRTLCVDATACSRPLALEEYEPGFLALLSFFVGRWLSIYGPESQQALKLQKTLESLKQKSKRDTVPAWLTLVEISRRARHRERIEDVMDATESSAAGAVASRLHQFFQHRCFFVTEGNQIGIGPNDLQQGSQVCIVPGLPFPLILEKRESGRYSLVGQGYIQGLMRGQGMKDASFANLEIE